MHNLNNNGYARGSGDHGNDEHDKKRPDEFKFSYISYGEFNAIFKQVKRERQRKQEAKDWEKFLTKKEQAKTNVKCCESNVNSSINDGSKEAPTVESEQAQVVTKEPAQFAQVPQISQHYQMPYIHKENYNFQHDYVFENDNEITHIEPYKPPDTAEGCVKQDSVESNLENKRKSSPTQKDRDDKILIAIERKSLMKKLEDLRGKIVLTLSGIDQAFNDQPFEISQEEIDILRTKKRNSAFTSRFKRNYHYQLVCQTNEIKKILGNETILKTKPLMAAQKFVSAHQSILQALQALEKHLLASCTNEESFIWLKEFIDSMCELSSLLPSCEGIDFNMMDNRNNVKLACEQLNEKIEKINNRSNVDTRINKKRVKKLKPGTTPQDNLWMYRTHRLTWKEKAADMAKIQMARRKRKKGTKEELGLDKKLPSSELKLLKMEVKQREGAELRRHSRTMREEQVRTMMEIIPEDSESENEGDIKKQNGKNDESKLKNEPKANLQELIDCRNAVLSGKSPQKQNVRKQIEQTETKSDDPANVKVVYIKCENEDIPRDSSRVFKKVKKNLVREYKKAFKAFKSQSVWYDDKVDNIVKGMTTRLTDEFLKEVVKEINVDHILSKIVDLELKEN